MGVIEWNNLNYIVREYELLFNVSMSLNSDLAKYQKGRGVKRIEE